MPVSRRDFLKLTGAALGTVGTGFALNQAKPTPQALAAADDPVLHLLNRITWGPRPDELERAQAIGFEAYLDEQLSPDTLDDSEMETRLASLPALNMDRRTVYRLEEHRVYMALVEGMILRAVYSKRQLLERMVEFWSDHFNIAAGDFAHELVGFQNRAIRPHALGNFRDMLFATAQSPAMLYYLDNFINVAEHPNENYARELLELHTLGVDGGYTETDVREVARAFTGWTVHDGTPTGFYFDLEVHDTGEKTVLGHRLPAGRGIEDGLHVLDIVARHPSTARFICRKLCVRFVSDNPPQSLVESAAAVWMANHGEIRPVLRHIFLSEEFRQSVGQKLRRPLDFFIGALRATGTEIHSYWVMDEMLAKLAQTPYGWGPPDGYPDTAPAWMTSSGLLARWNTALALTHTATSEADTGMTAHLYERIGEPTTVGELVDAVARQVFAAPLPAEARGPFIAFAADDGGPDTPVTHHLLSRKLSSLFALMLASVLYQWR